MDSTTLTTKTVLAGTYITLASSSFVLTRLSQVHVKSNQHAYQFDPVTVTLTTESLKFLVSVVMLLVVESRGLGYLPVSQSEHAVDGDSKPSYFHSLSFAFPALCYFAVNNIHYLVLTAFPPAVAHVLLNISIITTAVMFRHILQRTITSVQWASLVALFCAIASISTDALPHDTNNHTIFIPSTASSFGYACVLLQCLAGSFGNIYSEKVLKQGASTSIHRQNAYIYFYGMVFNALSLILRPSHLQVIFHHGPFHGYNAFTWGIVACNTILGLTISVILKHIDNMFHVFVHQATTVVVTLGSILLFSFQPSPVFVLSALIVGCSIFIYNRSRVSESNILVSSNSSVECESS